MVASQGMLRLFSASAFQHRPAGAARNRRHHRVAYCLRECGARLAHNPRKEAGRSHMMRIIQGDFSDPRLADLLRIHLTSARAETAPGSAHALDVAGLQSPDISFWTIWDDQTLLGVGALKRLS